MRYVAERTFLSVHDKDIPYVASMATVSSANKTKRVLAQWDTGATNSAVSYQVASELGLVQRATKMVRAGGECLARPVYVVDIELCPGLKFYDVEVFGLNIGSGGLDIIIGMDIISLGDLSLSRYDGEIRLAFRVPSMCHASFEESSH